VFAGAGGGGIPREDDVLHLIEGAVVQIGSTHVVICSSRPHEGISISIAIDITDTYMKAEVVFGTSLACKDMVAIGIYRGLGVTIEQVSTPMLILRTRILPTTYEDVSIGISVYVDPAE